MIFFIVFFIGFAYLFIRQMDKTQDIVPPGIGQNIMLTIGSIGVTFNICMVIYAVTL